MGIQHIDSSTVNRRTLERFDAAAGRRRRLDWWHAEQERRKQQEEADGED